MGGKVGDLVHSGCYNKNVMYCVAYKQQKFISHSVNTEKSKFKTLADSVSGKTASWFRESHFSLCPRMVERVRELSGVSLMRALILLRGLHSHDLITSLRPHLLLHHIGD